MRNLSRKDLQKDEAAIKDTNAFIEGADSSYETKTVRKPKLTEDAKKKPISISLTKGDTKDFLDLVKKFNAIAYNKGEDLDINRSDLIILMKNYFLEMDDKKFFDTINKIIR